MIHLESDKNFGYPGHSQEFQFRTDYAQQKINWFLRKYNIVDAFPALDLKDLSDDLQVAVSIGAPDDYINARVKRLQLELFTYLQLAAAIRNEGESSVSSILTNSDVADMFMDTIGHYTSATAATTPGDITLKYMTYIANQPETVMIKQIAAETRAQTNQIKATADAAAKKRAADFAAALNAKRPNISLSLFENGKLNPIYKYGVPVAGIVWEFFL